MVLGHVAGAPESKTLATWQALFGVLEAYIVIIILVLSVVSPSLNIKC